MHTVTQIIYSRNRRRIIEKRNPWFRLGLGLSLILCLIGVTFSLAAVWFYSNLTHKLPSVELLPALLEPPNGILLQPTRLYDRSRQHVLLTLENPIAENKQYLYVTVPNQESKNAFSQELIDATLSANDPDFWKHGGYSITGWSIGTHPTLAQQLVSELMLDSEAPSIKRNIRERLLAAQVTARYGREKVLEWYLNSAHYGNLNYGADAAARIYFGKSASEISLSEAAMLTAISQFPDINPVIYPEFLKQQQEHVIIAMLANGVITPEEAQHAAQEELWVQAGTNDQQIAPEFTKLVLNQVSSLIPLKNLYRGGYEIITSLDYDLQKQAVCAVEAEQQQLRGEEIVNVGDEDCTAAQFLPSLQFIDNTQIRDIQAEIVVVDPKTGQVLAYVGTEGSNDNELELPTHTAGTILSPFIFLTGFTRGVSPSTLLWDIPVGDVKEQVSIEASQTGEQNLFEYHGPVRARIAMVNDYYAATEDLLDQVRVENILKTEHSFGIDTNTIDGIPLNDLDDIYAQKYKLLDIVSAYAVFANRGIKAGQSPNAENTRQIEEGLISATVLNVMGADGRTWLDWSEPETQPIISPQLAYLITNILSDETARSASLGLSNLLEIDSRAGVKIGYPSIRNESWSVGYNNEIVVGVWVGALEDETIEISPVIPAGLWRAIMQYATSQTVVKDSAVPDGITTMQVCDPSGLLVSPLCPAIVEEVFLQGSEPSQVDDLYQKYPINRESGLLATVFTPEDLVENKVYMVVPPQATDWAINAGLPIPPTNYDAIYTPQDVSEDVYISDPTQFDHIKGLVSIYGTASGSGFAYYRVQVGQGLNPQRWVQIGDDVTKTVQNGLLGTWDTRGMDGLYVIQLQVVREDQRVDRALLQVTIDNSQPAVKILSPAEGEIISYQRGEKIMVQAEAGDNLMVEQVEFYIDDRLESVLVQPPFIILWQMQQGEHRIILKVYDLAGNFTEAMSNFSVK